MVFEERSRSRPTTRSPRRLHEEDRSPALVAGTVAGCRARRSPGAAIAQEKLTVWWVKGFYKSEDDALFEAIKKFEEKTGVKVELSQYAPRT